MQVTCIYVGNIHFVHFIHSVHSFHFLMKLASHLHLSFASLIFQHGTLYAYSASIFFLFLASFLLQFMPQMVSCSCQSFANPALKREARRKTNHTKNMKTYEQNIELLNQQAHQSSIEKDLERAEREAGKIGIEAGENAAAWVSMETWGGRVTSGEKEAAQSFITAFDDGDYSTLPEPPNLSGEWAGDETPASLMETLFGEDWQDVEEFRDSQDVMCTAWENGAHEGFYSSLVQSAQSILS